MFKKTDPYTLKKNLPLQDGKSNKVGNILIEYLLTKYDDVELTDFSSVAKSKTQRFLLSCKQRISIINDSAQDLTPKLNNNKYCNYPAVVNPIISLDIPNAQQIQLLDYSPITINTQIQSTGSVGNSAGTTNSTSKSNTVGSSNSQTNSYDVSVSYGAHVSMLDAGVNDSVTASYGHSNTKTTDKSNTNSSENSNSRSQDTANSSSMSMKDWGAYSIIDEGQKISWIFGQEYPWDAVLYRDLDPSGATFPGNTNQKKILISDTVNAKLTDGKVLFPASHLAMFGVNFAMSASWIITMKDEPDSDEIRVEHTISYYTASHLLNTLKAAEVYLDSTPLNLVPALKSDSLTTDLNLNMMALDPVSIPKPAIVGFTPSKFIVNPANGPFVVISATNNLLIHDNTVYAPKYPSAPGFQATDLGLSASFLHPAPISPLSIIIYFKITDSLNEYKLYLKNWVGNNNGVMLTITVNEDKGNQIVKYVNAQEAEGGESNLLTISLRNLDFSSIDYHDYLQLGLNAIQIDISPMGDQTTLDFLYILKAVSIERS